MTRPILHVCDSIIGGTGSYLAELLTLQAKRYGAGAVALLAPEEHRDHIEPGLAASGVDFRFFGRPSRVRGMAALTPAYLKALRTRQPALVHAHSFGAGVVTRLAPRLGQPKLVFCPHGWAFDMELSAPVRHALAGIERALAARADRIVLISEHEAAIARRAGIAPAKLAVVPNGIALAAPAVASAAWQDDRLKLLFVGRFDRQKGLDVLLDAVRPLGDRIALRVIGGSVVSGAFDTAGAPPFVEFLGWRSRLEVAAHMAGADALVVPSRWEGFGLVAVEAMRLGTAVIASTAGGLREILGDGRYGFSFPAGDPAALRQVLASLDRATLAARAAVGQERFRACYTAERMEAAMDDLYQSLLSPDTMGRAAGTMATLAERG